MSLHKLFSIGVRRSLKNCDNFYTNKKNFVRCEDFKKEQRRFIKHVAFEDIPDVSLSAIKKKFKECEISFEERYTNFVIGCPICTKGGEAISDKASIHVNKRTGAFSCEYCNHTGSWLDMDSYISAKHQKRKISKDNVIIKELERLQSYLKAVKKNTISLDKLSEEEYQNVLKKFQLPEILSSSTLTNLGISLDITHSYLYVPLLNTAFNLIGYKVINYKSSTTKIEPVMDNTQSTGVVVAKSLKHKDTCVVVANVADWLVLVNAQVPYTVICLPNGLAGLSVHALPCFDRYGKVILWLGDDLVASDASRMYARKIGERRCLVIRPTDKIPLPHQEPQQNFKAVFEMAKPVWHKSITTFASLRDDVLADLQNIDRVQGIKWNRYPALNRLLKGHRRGELTVFTGPTGSGKTTFISEYSLDLAMQGVNTLWGSFEIRNARLARTMLQQMSGIPLDEHIEKYDYWADKFEELPIYYMTFHGQQSIKVVMEAIEHATYVHDIAHVIIDNLQFMMGMSEDTKHVDRFWKQDLIVANFRSFATRRNCHVTLVIHPRKEKDAEDLTTSSIFGGAKASQEADNILIIQDRRLASLKGRKFLQLSKNRYSGDLGIIPLEFDKASLSFAPKRKKEEKDKDKSAS